MELRKTPRLIPFVLPLALGACLFSSTRVFEFDVVRSGNLGQPLVVPGSGFDQAALELIRSRTFEESQPDIRRVDRVGIEADLINSGATTRFSLYFSLRDDLTDPAHEGTLLLGDVEVASGDVHLTTTETQGLVTNLDAFRAAVRDGVFTLYAVGDGGSGVTIQEMFLVLTVTVGY